jgi:hypothetical protein
MRLCMCVAATMQRAVSALDMHVDGNTLENHPSVHLLMGVAYFGTGKDWGKALTSFTAQMAVETELAQADM